MRQTRVHPAQLVLPLFVADGIDRPAPVPSLPGVLQHTPATAAALAAEAHRAGLGGVLVFGVPADTDKDDTGSAAWDPDGIQQRGIKAIVETVGDDLVVIADTCLDEFTSHGHCGVLDAAGGVDNDATLEVYGRVAVAQARAGAHLVAPSGMMDGQVRAIRRALDVAGFSDTGILAYAAKFASSLYGPFRDAVGSSFAGHRRTYQVDPANAREAVREAALDEAEAADMVMVKPAAAYLDIVAAVAARSQVPVAAYHVSGEYAMIEAAADRRWLDRRAAHLETAAGIVRAGADIVITYAALDLAGWLVEAER